MKREKGSLLTREDRDCRKILTYPNDIRKSRGVGGEERQQEPPRSHFRFRSAPPSLPPPATPPPPPAPPAWEPAPPPFCRGDSHRWKTRWDGEFIKMRRANLRVRPSNISPGEEKRAEKGGGASALCHDDTVTTGVPRIREVDVRANRFDSCRPNGNEGSG